MTLFLGRVCARVTRCKVDTVCHTPLGTYNLLTHSPSLSTDSGYAQGSVPESSCLSVDWGRTSRSEVLRDPGDTGEERPQEGRGRRGATLPTRSLSVGTSQTKFLSVVVIHPLPSSPRHLGLPPDVGYHQTPHFEGPRPHVNRCGH